MNQKSNRIDISEVVGKGYGDFWRTKKRYRVVKGGRASKKSVTTAIWFIYNLMKYPLSNVLCVRNTFNTHKDSTFAALKWAAKRLGVYHLWAFTINPLEATYKPTGQKILFRGFDDPMKLLSITVSVGVLCWTWIEEAYEIENEAEFEMLDESVRGEMPEGLWKQITLTYNPWIHTHWTKTRFFDKQDPNAFTLTTTYHCNEFIDENDREIIEKLAITNPGRYRVVGLGEYGMPGGTFFDVFREDIHVIEGFDVPREWRRLAGMDYGTTTCSEFVTQDPKTKNFYVYDEWDFVVTGELNRTDKALSYYRKLEDINELDIITVADVTLWNTYKEFGKELPASADYFTNVDPERDLPTLGLKIVPVVKKKSDNKGYRETCADFIKDCLSYKKDSNGLFIQKPKLFIFERCKNLIRTLPELITDPKNDRVWDMYAGECHYTDGLKQALITFDNYNELIEETEQEAEERRIERSKRIA
jgi:phage terminase large subunit